MSLDWDLRKIADNKTVCWDHDGEGGRTLKKTTETLIWYTMFCGVGWGITEDNVEEFYARIALYERLFGSLFSIDGEPYYFDRDTVRAHVGLWTNVSPEPRHEWVARMFHRFAIENGAQITRSESGDYVITYDSTREYNRWTLFDRQGQVEGRYYSQLEAESALEDARERDAEEAEV